MQFQIDFQKYFEIEYIKNLHFHFLLSLNQPFLFYSDPPEVHMDQQWAQVGKIITVKIDCIVHGNPAPQVRQDQWNCTALFMKYNS